jgi:hypothetical protein
MGAPGSTNGPWGWLGDTLAGGSNGTHLLYASESPGLGDAAELNRLQIAASPDLYDALVEAKKEMWLSARHQWTLADFNNWAVVQQINAALTKADGKARGAA